MTLPYLIPEPSRPGSGLALSTKPIIRHLLGCSGPLFSSVDDLSDLSGVDVTAHLFQERLVDKAYEVRLTAVGDALFAATIEASNEAARADWRADLEALRYRPVEVPESVADGVRTYLSTFGLSYGAFDFVVDREGCYTFLECNPGGQFGWIEANTGLPITSALTDLLGEGMQ